MRLQTQFQRSQFGDWRITTAELAPPLSSLLTILWDVEGTTTYAAESILPSGHVSVLINLASDQFLLTGDTRTRFATAWVAGMQRRPLLVQSQAHSHLVGARFTQEGAWRFFGLPLEEITDRVLDIDLVLGRSLLALREQFAEHRDPEWRLRRLAEFIRRRCGAGPAMHPAVQLALARLDETRGCSAVRMLLEETGLSQKHLVRKFREQVGMSPKLFGRILKFRSAVERLQAGAPPDLGMLALDCGYYDQPHFNLDFRAFAGVTPSEFLRRRLPEDVTTALVSD